VAGAEQRDAHGVLPRGLGASLGTVADEGKHGFDETGPDVVDLSDSFDETSWSPR